MRSKTSASYLVKPFPITFLLGLALVNAIALFRFDIWYIGSLFAFIYIIVTPGLLILPFLTKEKLSFALGIALSVALSVLALMLAGLALNTVLPFFKIAQPLSTLPLLLTFDALVYALLIANQFLRTESPLAPLRFNTASWTLVCASLSLPILAFLGAISLNNGGSNLLTMIAIALMAIFVPIIIAGREKIGGSVPPIVMYAAALALLLANSMRGWFITGHDVLLEYHVFSLVNTAHIWSMALYQDPYMACLSITILPTYLVNLLQTSGIYIFKFFLQFIGALPVVFVYYLCRKYVSSTLALLASFLYITFPTFMTDMAFLNRQGIAFVFFAAMIFVLLTPEYFGNRARNFSLILFGAGMVVSHYATSYTTVAVLIAAYVLNRLLRLKTSDRRQLLLTLPFILSLVGLVALWSVFITNTSGNFFATIRQIATDLEHPLSLDTASTGPAAYGLLHSESATPQSLLRQLTQEDIQQARNGADQANFYPLSLAESYSTVPATEPLVPLTALGASLQAAFHIDLAGLYGGLKQWYARILQVLLLLGTLGLLLRYGFKKNVLQQIPTEYAAIAISCIAILAGQTLLPTTAVDYGLLRLFQQSLIILGLPIVLTVFALSEFISRVRGGATIAAAILLFFFAILSGLVPQLTGGARPPLQLNNYGFYYDSYYTHAQELSSVNWLAANANRSLPVQASRYFSTTRILAYSGIAPNQNLVPESIEKNAYIYLDLNNVKTGTFIDDVGGNVIYYKLPLAFLADNKNLIYNNGGSEIYK